MDSMPDSLPIVEKIQSTEEILSLPLASAPAPLPAPPTPSNNPGIDVEMVERASPSLVVSHGTAGQIWLTLEDANIAAANLAKLADVILPVLQEDAESINALRLQTMAFALQFGWKAQVSASHNDSSGLRALALRCSKFNSGSGENSGCKWALRAKEISKDGPVKVYLANYHHTHPVSANRVEKHLIVPDIAKPTKFKARSTPPAAPFLPLPSPNLTIEPEAIVEEVVASGPIYVEEESREGTEGTISEPVVSDASAVASSSVLSTVFIAETGTGNKKKKESNVPVFPSQTDIVDLATELLRLCPKQLSQNTLLEFSSPVDMRIYITAVAIESGFACAIQNRSANTFSLQCSRGENSGTRYKIGCTYGFASQFDLKKKKWVVTSSNTKHDHPLFEWEYQNGKSRRVIKQKLGVDGRINNIRGGSFSRASDEVFKQQLLDEAVANDKADNYDPLRRKKRKIEKIIATPVIVANEMVMEKPKSVVKVQPTNIEVDEDELDELTDSDSDSESEAEVVRPTKRTKRTSIIDPTPPLEFVPYSSTASAAPAPAQIPMMAFKAFKPPVDDGSTVSGMGLGPVIRN